MYVKDLPSQEYLKTILSYDPMTGVFIWKNRSDWEPHNISQYCGKVAGYNGKGYWKIVIDGILYQAHRLAWVYMHGDIPIGCVPDHIDGNTLNNKLNNLRLATSSLNSANAKRHRNKKLPKGITQWANGKYLARITKNYKTVCLGTFKNLEDAHNAYKLAAEDLYGQFAKAV